MVAGIAVLVLLAAMGVLLLPPYIDNWKLQGYLNDLASDPATVQKSPEVIQSNIVNKAASLGLPVRSDDVRVTRSADGLRIEVLYLVQVTLGPYSVELHFRPAA